MRSNIYHICTDVNSCYDVAFFMLKIPELHIMSKAETHLIESSNSSIRDNLARFNRRSKQFSKTIEMLTITLEFFIKRDIIMSAINSWHCRNIGDL